MEIKTIKEAQEFVKKFVHERNWETSEEDILLHLMEELGEVSRNVLKRKDYGGNHTQDSKQNMDEELADVFYLILKLANKTNVDLNLAFQNKMKENIKRFS